jgi:hypothetical protein
VVRKNQKQADGKGPAHLNWRCIREVCFAKNIHRPFRANNSNGLARVKNRCKSLRMSLHGTNRTSNDVRYTSALGGKAEVI